MSSITIYSRLKDNRENISKIISRVTGGEILDLDYMVDSTSYGRTVVTIFVVVPAKVKRQYDMDMNLFLDKYDDTIRYVISSFGLSDIFKNTIKYMVL
ncbi:hypothetical protein EBU94_08850 [bacterium]|nr:hypothetical protein [bacterium]